MKKQPMGKRGAQEVKITKMATFSQDARDRSRELSTRPKLNDRISNKSQFHRGMQSSSNNNGDERCMISCR